MTLSRRGFLRGAALAAGAVGLSACLPTVATAPPAATATASPSPSPPPSPSPAPTVPPLTLRQKIARLLVVGFRGLGVDDSPWVARAIADEGLGGVILFDRDGKRGGARNVESPQQVRDLVAGLRELAVDRELIVAIDQEGGRVTRLAPRYGYPEVASQAAVGAAGDATVATWADGLAATLADAGVNLNLAPVVDLNVNPANPAIGALDRSFAADPATVARFAAITVEAHRAAGVRTCLKHFPGIGSATANTDLGVADVTATWTDAELDPYRDLVLLGLVDSVMAGHVVNGQLDPDAPASLSAPTVDGLLRVGLGWDGVIVTDDLQAGAIADAYAFEAAVELALAAGNDLLLLANQQVYDTGVVTTVIDIVEALVAGGRIDEARIDRSVLRVLGLFPARTA